jgi:hypothetical protein
MIIGWVRSVLFFERNRVGLDQGRVGLIYMLYFFRFLIDFDWIADHLISGRVRFGLGQIKLTFFKKSDRIGFRFN